MTRRAIKRARRAVTLERLLIEIEAHEEQLETLSLVVRSPIVRGVLTCACVCLRVAEDVILEDLLEGGEVLGGYCTDA